MKETVMRMKRHITVLKKLQNTSLIKIFYPEYFNKAFSQLDIRGRSEQTLHQRYTDGKQGT